MSVSESWGTTAEERARDFPCDASLDHIDDRLFRGITINAAPEVVFRWLCQLQVAPYSYDLLDVTRISPHPTEAGKVLNS